MPAARCDRKDDRINPASTASGSSAPNDPSRGRSLGLAARDRKRLREPIGHIRSVFVAGLRQRSAYCSNRSISSPTLRMNDRPDVPRKAGSIDSAVVAGVYNGFSAGHGYSQFSSCSR